MTQPTGIAVYHSTDPLRPDTSGRPAAERLAGFVPFPSKKDSGDSGFTDAQAAAAWKALVGLATDPAMKALMAKAKAQAVKAESKDSKK